MDGVSNARPLAIFSGYMILAASLTAACIAIARSGPAYATVAVGPLSTKAPVTLRRNSRHRLAIAVFVLLAAISLGTTWYHMFCFFSWSYRQWALVHPTKEAGKVYLGEWLRDTTLFKQAWASTLETAPRSWWSLQIFGFCANWSVMLAVQETKRRIPYMWVFMLLGQIVAISFASNLFFVTVLLYDVVPKEPSSSKFAGGQSAQTGVSDLEVPAPTVLSAAFWYDTVLAINTALALKVPAMFGKPGFMRFLLAPHLLAFAPLILNRIMPETVAQHRLTKPAFTIKVATMFVLVATGTVQLFREGGDLNLALKTLHEHPAVGSVGWDVICCWASYTAWELLGVE